MRRGGVSGVEPIELSRDPQARVRHDAIHALSKIGYARAALPVWERLSDHEPAGIAKAAYTLGVLRERGAAPELASLLMHQQPEVRTAAVEALERLGALALEALAGVLTGGDREGRRRAADVLASIAHPYAIQTLATGLDDPAGDVRVSVLMALSGFDDPRATTAIAAAAGDPDHRVRALADRLTQDR